VIIKNKIKSRYNNYQLSIGKLGDFFIHVDMAKRLYELDESCTTVFVMKNESFLSEVSGQLGCIKVKKNFCNRIAKVILQLFV
jgi:hypothetical protein